MTTAQRLRDAGLRRTQARQVVLDLLAKVPRPLSHQEIARRKAVRELDRVTLYRTLTTLQEAGLIHRIQGVDGVWRFGAHRAEAGRCGGDHIHFLCLDCNRMTCLPEQPLPWVQAPDGAEIAGKQLLVYGRCAACRGKA